MMMHIRPYQDRDKDSVVALWREVFPNSPAWNVPEEDVERKLKVQPDLFFVAEVGVAESTKGGSEGDFEGDTEEDIEEGIVGTAMAGYDGHRGWVYYVAVSPRFRRKGIGKALMDKVVQELKKIGCPKINLQVRGSNKQAMEFYKKLGYAVEDRVSMSKKIIHED